MKTVRYPTEIRKRITVALVIIGGLIAALRLRPAANVCSPERETRAPLGEKNRRALYRPVPAVVA